MAINVDYGPISTAVMLGTNAGRGQYWQNQQQEDDKFMSLMNDAQRTADARNATKMQNALGYADLQAKQQTQQASDALEQTKLDSQQAYQTGELGLRKKQVEQEGAYQQGILGVRGTANGIAQQRADTGANRADAYQQHVDDQGNRIDYLNTQVKTSNADRTELSALQQQVKAAHEEWSALQDPKLSKRLGPTKRDDVADTEYGTALDKFNRATALRDAKLQAMTQQPTVDPMAGARQALPPAGNIAPVAPPANGPGMPPMGMQQPQTPPETMVQALTSAAASEGVRPADVHNMPPAPQQVASQLKAMVMGQTSDPAQQRYLFYRLMIQAGMDPTKPAVAQPQMPPGQPPLQGQ